MSKRIYDVEVTRDPGWGLWYLIYVPELDTTGQVPIADGDEGIERVAREVIGLWLDAYEDSFGITIRKVADPSDRWLTRKLARAWAEGHQHRQRRGKDKCKCGAWSKGECACGRYGNGPLLSLEDNPYSKGADRG